MAVTNEKFGKAYKLCSVKEIQRLFKEGKKLYTFPFSCQYDTFESQDQKVPFQIVISVPKRNFKKAVDRNRLKRLIREAFRKNKVILEAHLEQKNLGMTFVLVYTHKEQFTYKEFNDRIEVFLKRLTQEI